MFSIRKGFFFLSPEVLPVCENQSWEFRDNISSKETKISVFPWLPLLAEKGGGKKISM